MFVHNGYVADLSKLRQLLAAVRLFLDHIQG
jgi:hypothetical protein